MKKETITKENLKWFYTYLRTNEEVQEVVDYLTENKTTITISKTHDPQSGWEGQDVFLDGRNLSGNGFCFKGEKLLKHVRFFKEYNNIRNTLEYKNYLKDKNRFEEVYDFFR